MIKDTIKGQYNFSEEFRKKADIFDIFFITYCLVVPFFMENKFISIIIFSYLGLFYMQLVVKGFAYKDFIKHIQT